MLLNGKKGIILNVVNKNSIGWAIAESAVENGAEVMIGAQNERTLENLEKLIDGRPRMRATIVDVTIDDHIKRLRTTLNETYGKIDFLVHSLAFAPREALQGRLIDTSLESFQTAMEVSCYSLIKLCSALEDKLEIGASVIALSYLGSEKIAKNYNVMGLAKAALESATRYLAADLGEKQVRVNILSPGPLNTVAARGIKDLTNMISHVQEIAPLRYAYSQQDVGRSAVYLMSNLSCGVTAQTIFIDSGYNKLAF